MNGAVPTPEPPLTRSQAGVVAAQLLDPAATRYTVGEAVELQFLVLVSDAGRHSLWPTFRDVPQGWDTVHGPVPRQDALAYVEANRTEITPRHTERAGAPAS